MEVGFYEHHHWKLLSVLCELMSDQFDKFSHHLFMLMCAKCILWFECKDWDGLSDVLWLYCTVCDNCKWLIHWLNKDFFQCHSLPIQGSVCVHCPPVTWLYFLEQLNNLGKSIIVEPWVIQIQVNYYIQMSLTAVVFTTWRWAYDHLCLAYDTYTQKLL